jgi:hypothetical protein
MPRDDRERRRSSFWNLTRRPGEAWRALRVLEQLTDRVQALAA